MQRQLLGLSRLPPVGPVFSSLALAGRPAPDAGLEPLATGMGEVVSYRVCRPAGRQIFVYSTAVLLLGKGRSGLRPRLPGGTV